jgi:NAD(P)-dependent dehydrogenase (short-subunit alcohol dehydrogenase family)
MSDKNTAIITGATGGIGAGLVEAFLKEAPTLAVGSPQKVQFMQDACCCPYY